MTGKAHDSGIDMIVEMASNGEALLLVNAAGADEGRKANPLVPRVSSPKSSPSTLGSPRIDARVLAQQLALQPVTKSKQDQWGLLTAVSDKARKRTQGCHIMLHSSEHVLGRVVPEVSCQFDSPAVSGRHCTITRKVMSVDGRIKTCGSEPSAAGDVYAIFVKDSSSNGTVINKERLKKSGPEVLLRHGDIISLVGFPEHESAFAFVYREVIDDSTKQHVKRKISSSEHEVEGSVGEGKRIKGTMKGPSEGPVSLDDVRRLQRSNEELRQQLEAHVLEIEKMRGEFRAAEALHLVELKELRASVTEMHVQQIEEVRLELASKSKELEESTFLCVQQQTTIEDLNHRLAAAAQSRVDAEEAIQSHTNSIAELKKRLEDEFSQRQRERVEWEANLEAAVERTRIEAAEEVKRHSEASARMQKQQQEIIVDLQEADKENRRLADSLRMKLEAERQAVIRAEEKGRRLGLQLQEERLFTENAAKKAAEFEEELRQVYKEVEREKAAREFADVKVAKLELEMETSIRDLTLEKQRLQGARERIVLRETQLRAFYSTAAQVEALQQKQQEHLKVMLRTLEDGDGDGEYSQSRNCATPGQTDGARTEAMIIVGKAGSLAARPTSSPLDSDPGTRFSVKDKGLCARTGCADGKKGKAVEEGEGPHWKIGCTEQPDWMDGDTQQEDCLLASIPPSKSPAAGADDKIRFQNGFEEGRNSGTEAGNMAPDDTQPLDHGLAATTQMLADSLQEIGSGEGNGTAVGERYQAGIEDGGEGSGGATMEVDVNVQEPIPVEPVRIEAAAENEGEAGDGRTVSRLSSGTPILNEGTRRTVAYLDTQLETRDQDTLCTEDLLTSETAGSWALGGTQASVHAENESWSRRNVGTRIGGAIYDSELERRENEGTLCTDDLASEVAGSWRTGTPASVHADNESISSDERNQISIEEGGSQVEAAHRQGSRPRSNPQHILLEEVLNFADSVNSQNSLSPATTNPLRNERDALNEMLDIVEPGFGSLHGLSRVTRHQSDTDDSTTDDEDENEAVNASSDASQPLNISPSVSVR